MKRLICLLLCAITIFSMVSCGNPKHEYDPGFFEVNTSNYTRYLKVVIESGETTLNPAGSEYYIRYSVSSKEDVTYQDCRVVVKFKVNDSVKEETIKLDKNGSASGDVLVSFETAYDIEYGYEIIDVYGTVFDEGRGIENGYVKYNNIRYEYYSNLLNEYWAPVYKAKNNTKVLYFTDKIYTKSGAPVPIGCLNIFRSGYKGFWSVKPLNKVETIIYDGTILNSDLDDMYWAQVYKVMPNLKTVYIRNIVDDLEETEKEPFNIGLPKSGVKFYIGGDTGYMAMSLENAQFVNGIYDASEFDLDSFKERDKDNK